jgi:hypothetical protein
MMTRREERMEEVLMEFKREMLLALGQEQRTAANALGKATRREAEKTADAMQERLERIDWALASDTAAIEVLQ